MNSFDNEHQLRVLLVFNIILLCSSSACFVNISFGQVLGPEARLPDSEVEALKEIATTLGKTDWNFTVNPCSGESGWNTSTGAPIKVVSSVVCNCTLTNDNVCHITEIFLKSQTLPGILPPGLVKLPYLQILDLTRNYLNGTIPKEWGSMQFLNIISLSANRLSGPIPKEVGNISNLTELVLEANQLSGHLPPELGKLVNLQRISISSNYFTGQLPDLSGLTTMTDFRISDNLFTGKLPNFIEKWTKLERLEMQASGFEGPIPSGISLLENMKDMRISDLNGTEVTIPLLSNMTKLRTLVLRSCNITGALPPYLGEMPLKHLDLSFNKLSGEIPSTLSLREALFVYLTGNLLSGIVPEWMPRSIKSIDLSYNNFSLGRTETSNCQQQSVNLFGSSLLGNTSTGIVPCLRSLTCKKTWDSFHINCGGREVNINGREITTFEDDFEPRGSSTYYQSRTNWAFSSTGTFMDNNNDFDNYIAKNDTILSMNNSPLYTTARLSPLSLTYYGFCLQNGSYNVSLHFAEIVFKNDNIFSSLGRRIFDVYIQGQRVLHDFNIAKEAGGSGNAVIKTFTTNVTSNTLEIRFTWAGKGTTVIPVKGTYGPLVSAISVRILYLQMLPLRVERRRYLQVL